MLELVGVGALGKGACRQPGAQCYAVLIPAISCALSANTNKPQTSERGSTPVHVSFYWITHWLRDTVGPCMCVLI